jgi:hypothetical protein
MAFCCSFAQHGAPSIKVSWPNQSLNVHYYMYESYLLNFSICRCGSEDVLMARSTFGTDFVAPTSRRRLRVSLLLLLEKKMIGIGVSYLFLSIIFLFCHQKSAMVWLTRSSLSWPVRCCRPWQKVKINCGFIGRLLLRFGGEITPFTIIEILGRPFLDYFDLMVSSSLFPRVVEENKNEEGLWRGCQWGRQVGNSTRWGRQRGGRCGRQSDYLVVVCAMFDMEKNDQIASIIMEY